MKTTTDKIIEARRAWLRGDITGDQLIAASDAARAAWAAWAAAWDAREAAWDARVAENKLAISEIKDEN